MKQLNLYLGIILILICSTTYAKTEIFRGILPVGTSYVCEIVQVDDGDTFDIQCGERYIPNVRLFGVNAPDSNGPDLYKHCYYNEAKSAINLLKNRELNIDFFGSDLCKDYSKGCRNIVKLTDIKTGIDINELLVSKGFMFSWTQFSNISLDLKLKYIKAESNAKNNNLGLWGKCIVNYNLQTTMDSGIPNKMTN